MPCLRRLIARAIVQRLVGRRRAPLLERFAQPFHGDDVVKQEGKLSWWLPPRIEEHVESRGMEAS